MHERAAKFRNAPPDLLIGIRNSGGAGSEREAVNAEIALRGIQAADRTAQAQIEAARAQVEAARYAKENARWVFWSVMLALATALTPVLWQIVTKFAPTCLNQ